MNFLTLCKTLARECGMPATMPASVEGQTGEALRFVEWIKQANADIQLRWSNWKFLWGQHTFNTVDGTSTYSAPSDIGEWDQGRFTVDGSPLSTVEYHHWSEPGALSGPPSVAVIMPDNSLKLYPSPDGAYVIKADYFKTPQMLSVNGDVPLIPERFHMLIVYYAMVKYAYFEAAPEVLENAKSFLADQVPQLEASQLPCNSNIHNFSSSEFTVMVE